MCPFSLPPPRGLGQTQVLGRIFGRFLPGQDGRFQGSSLPPQPTASAALGLSPGFSSPFLGFCLGGQLPEVCLGCLLGQLLTVVSGGLPELELRPDSSAGTGGASRVRRDDEKAALLPCTSAAPAAAAAAIRFPLAGWGWGCVAFSLHGLGAVVLAVAPVGAEGRVLSPAGVGAGGTCGAHCGLVSCSRAHGDPEVCVGHLCSQEMLPEGGRLCLP